MRFVLSEDNARSVGRSVPEALGDMVGQVLGVESRPRSFRGHISPINHNSLSALIPPVKVFSLGKLGF